MDHKLSIVFLVVVVLALLSTLVKPAMSVGAICAAEAMWNAYKDMREANTKGCDKYFHCRGNRDAVRCGGSGRAVATAIRYRTQHQIIPLYYNFT